MEPSLIAKSSAEPGKEPRIGVYVCHCGSNIAQTVDCPKVAEEAGQIEGVVVSKDIGYACSEPGQQQIKNDIIENDLDRIVIALPDYTNQPSGKCSSRSASIPIF